MRRILYRSPAAIRPPQSACARKGGVLCAGLLLLLPPLSAARRPSYGGSLRIETAESIPSLDPAEPKLAGPVFETLVRLDDRGRPQPWLALSWTHDAVRNRWT